MLHSANFTLERIETLCEQQLEAADFYRKKQAVHELQSGVLFHMLRSLRHQQQNEFWSYVEKRFGYHRTTIARKMRLALRWAKQTGATDAQVLELAQACKIESPKGAPVGVQLAFEWIGDLATTDLMRREKIINYGPQNTGKLLGDPKKGRHTGENIQLKKQAEAGGAAATLGEFLDEFLNNKIYEQLADADLQHLRERVIEFETVVSNLALARKLKRLPDNWRLQESQP